MMPPDDHAAELTAAIEAMVRRGERARHLRTGRQALQQARVEWPLALIAGPAVLALVPLAGGEAPGLPSLVVALAGGPLSWAVIRVGAALAVHRPSRSEALAIFDEPYEPGDRLRTADFFLRAPGAEVNELETGFRAAAIRDAVRTAQAAVQLPTPWLEVPAARTPARYYAGLPVALVLAVLALFPPQATSLIPGYVASVPDRPAAASVPFSERREPVVPPAVTPRRPEQPEAAATAPSARRNPSKAEVTPPGEPAAGAGNPSAASDTQAGAASAAAGKKSTAPHVEPPRATEIPEPSKPEAARKPKAPKPSEASASSAQADSGQGRSASSSPPSPPMPEPPEAAERAGAIPDREVEDEAEQDEDEQQKSESAASPMRNEPVKDVDRNLSTLPPGEEDADARPNGRGGPGELKKSRGVPSMILGIPVPDRVPGTPGPGRTKTTQEFARPVAESHPPVDALAHAARSGPVGAVAQPELLPWRRQILERYFTPAKSAPSASADADREP